MHQEQQLERLTTFVQFVWAEQMVELFFLTDGDVRFSHLTLDLIQTDVHQADDLRNTLAQGY